MGGYDPYSASKGATELVTASYRRSFFNPLRYGDSHSVLVASCRAGNVIGGGDWSEDRLVPDIVRGIETGRAALIRSPHATRPWQHVLDALGGYLLLGERLLEGDREFASAWNFGPSDNDVMSVAEMCRLFSRNWKEAKIEIAREREMVHEAGRLKLDCSKAHTLLGWRGKWSAGSAVEKTAQWYRAFYKKDKIISKEQIGSYMRGE